MDALTALEVKIRPGQERPEVSRFLSVFQQLQGALREIDRAYLLRGSRPTWRFSRFDMDRRGTFVARIVPSGQTQKRPAHDLLVPVQALVDGVAELNDRAEVPRLYWDKTVSRIAQAGAPGRGVQEVSVATVNGKAGPHFPMSEPVRRNAERAVQGRMVSLGSVTGFLEAINARPVKRKGLFEIGILDPSTRHMVRGLIPEIMEHRLRDLWRERILAGGQVTRNDQGQALQIVVDELEFMPPDNRNRPRTDELLGIAPDWIGGQNVDEFLAEARRA
jgi:hypothetical protein